jgi:hypothetical protein
MRAKAISTIAALFAVAAFGQTPAPQGGDRTFHFANTDSVQGMQEIATVIRSVADIRNLTVDTTQRTLVLQSTASQAALADWLFNDLDKPANLPPQTTPDPAMHEYRMPGSNDDVVRVFYPKHAATIQELQEVAVLVRSIADIRRLFTYNEPRAVVMRGTADQAAAAEWLVNTLDTARQKPISSKLEYRMPGGNDDVVRVFLLTHADTVQQFQEIATDIRSIGDIRRLFTYNTARAVAMRGTADQAGLAEWLIGELDKPANSADSAVHEFHMAGTPEDVVRVFYLPHSGTVQHFQEIVTYIRSTTQIRRAFTYNAPRALTLRGTAAQIAQANQLIQERDKP